MLEFSSRESATHGLLLREHVCTVGVLPGPICVLQSPRMPLQSERQLVRACVALVLPSSGHCGVLQRCRRVSVSQVPCSHRWTEVDWSTLCNLVNEMVLWYCGDQCRFQR